MAKELPYFKFEPNQWENGNIQIFSREEKGLFIDLCSMYWSRLGELPLKLALQKLCNGNATALNSLCDEKIIEVIDGSIYIKFLSEQLLEFENLSSTNSKNAKEGWEKRRALKDLRENDATAYKSQSEIDAIREDNKKEEDKKDIKPDGSVFSFLEFWSLYPKKVGKEKTSKAYSKISEIDRQTIKLTLPLFLAYKPFATYSHPDPLTYLNGKRWNDEISSPKTQINKPGFDSEGRAILNPISL